MEVLQENLALHSVFVAQAANETRWERAHLTFNTSDDSSGSLIIIVSNFDFGEAAPEPGNNDLILTVDDVVLTLCLPCDYDSLGDVGGITVDGPNRIDVPLRFVEQYQFNASAPACPNETFTFTIESGTSLTS